VVITETRRESSLAAKQKRQVASLETVTSTLKNRVWGFANTPSGRPNIEAGSSWENATGSVQYTYRNASGRAEWLSRDPIGEGSDATLYSYVDNNPMDLRDPLGLWGVIGGGTASADAGAYAAGAGSTGSAGVGGFYNSETGGFSTGAFASGGAFANWGSHGVSAPSSPNNNNWSAGAFGGGGAMVGITNANCVQDLSGPFKTYSFNIGWGLKALGIQFSIGQNSAGKTIWSLAYSGPLGFPSGGGYGAAASEYNTNTVTYPK
jgi:RHS repeat-associated protein